MFYIEHGVISLSTNINTFSKSELVYAINFLSIKWKLLSSTYWNQSSKFIKFFISLKYIFLVLCYCLQSFINIKSDLVTYSSYTTTNNQTQYSYYEKIFHWCRRNWRKVFFFKYYLCIRKVIFRSLIYHLFFKLFQ